MRKISLLLLIVFCLLFSLSFISAFQGTSSSYSVDSKQDSVSLTNSTSTSFSQRFAGGIQAVSKYVSSLFSGRFGILNDQGLSLDINITSPLDGQEVVRGNDASTGEDDKASIQNSINITARVYQSGSSTGFSGAQCYFYVDSSFIGNSSTNSSGHCFTNYSVSSLSVGQKTVSINYTITTSDTKNVATDSITISLVRFVSTLTAGNLRSNGKYYDGDNATLSISISKINSTGTTSYDPQNISANATNAGSIVYPNGVKFYPGANITRLSAGSYSTNVSVNYSFGGFVRWDVLVSDNNYSDLISTAVHADKEICAGDFGAFSDWSACSGGTQTRSRTDSSSCTEVESQSCTTGGGGGGGGCTSNGFPDWSTIAWGSCVDGQQTRTRTDNCGNTETQFQQCGCVPNWDCGPWGECVPAGTPLNPLAFNDNGNNIYFNNLGNFNPNLMSQEELRIPIKIEKVENNFKVSDLNKEFVSLGYQKTIIIHNTLTDLFSQVLESVGLSPEVTSAECVSETDVGGTRCDPTRTNYYQTCKSALKKKVLTFSWKSTKCTSGLVCSGNGDCTCSELNSCDLEGALRCVNTNTYQECKSDVNGCLKWSSNTKCSSGNVCSEGECIVGKTSQSSVCNVGEKTCIGNRVYDCVSNSKNIANWVAGLRCSSNEFCSEGSCFVSQCFNSIRDGDETGIDCGGSCEECVFLSICGNSITENGEGCDDGNLVNGDGCSSSCQIQEITPNNNSTNSNQNSTDEGSNNSSEENFVLQPDQSLVDVNEVLQVTIFKGDQLSIAFESKRDGKALLRIRVLKTSESSITETEVHRIEVNEIKDGSIIVTVSSDPITLEIPEGGSEVVEFPGSEPSGSSGGSGSGSSGGSSGGGSSGGSSGIFGSGGPSLSPPGGSGPNYPYQTRTCTDLNHCDLNNQSYTEVQQCISNLNIVYSPQNPSPTVLNTTTINFQINASGNAIGAIDIKWYLNGAFQKGDSQSNSVSSILTKSFVLSSQVRADIIAAGQTQSLTWNVNVLPSSEYCEENWICDWSSCSQDVYRYASNCVDVNYCGSDLNKPYKQECTCTPDFECTEWTSCLAEYDFSDVLQGQIILNGTQKRFCTDKLSCENNTIETLSCELSSSISAKAAKWCYQDYIEIYEVDTGKLISRIKESNNNGNKKVDIDLVATEFTGYCNFCYDGVKNYDETDVDCGGENCPKCLAVGKYFDWLFYVKVSLWIILLLIVGYIAYTNRRELGYRLRSVRASGLRNVISNFRLAFRRKKKVSEQAVKKPEVIHKELEKSRKPSRFSLSKFFGRMLPIAIDIRIRIGGKISRIKEARRVRRIEKERLRKSKKIYETHEVVKHVEAKPVIKRHKHRIVLFADLRRKLKEWKDRSYYDTSRLENRLTSVIATKIREMRNKRRIKKHEKSLIRAERKKEKIHKKLHKSKEKSLKKQHKVRHKAEKKHVIKQIKHIQRRIRKKQIGKHEVPSLKKQLKEWEEKGYYGTTHLRKKLDKFEKRDPLK